VTSTERIKIAGRRLRWLVRLLAIATVGAAVVAFAVRGPLALLHVPPHVLSADAAPITGWRAAAVGALGLTVPAAYLVVLARLHQLADLYARGEVFCAASHAALRGVGVALIAVDAVAMLRAAATGPLLTALGATSAFIELELQSSLLIIGVLVLVIGRVMELAGTLDEADRLTI
jgi:hypothetical protein